MKHLPRRKMPTSMQHLGERKLLSIHLNNSGKQPLVLQLFLGPAVPVRTAIASATGTTTPLLLTKNFSPLPYDWAIMPLYESSKKYQASHLTHPAKRLGP